MSEKIELKGLTFQIGEKEVVLTIDEAEKLHEALKKLFAEQIIIREPTLPYIPYRPYIWWYLRTEDPVSSPYQITCTANSLKVNL